MWWPGKIPAGTKTAVPAMTIDLLPTFAGLIGAELPDLYAIADLVVSRGGANSLAELASLNKKVVVIPLGLATSRGDQIDNAKIYVRKLGWVLGAGPDFVETLELSLKGHIEKDLFENGVGKIVKEILKAAK